jgi:aerobic-type carbon monoxide dehydrogenase small subunit (CoxS/CutS family)
MSRRIYKITQKSTNKRSKKEVIYSMTEKKKKKPAELSRREFLKDAGLLVGGTAIGSTVILAACGGGETETVTNTVTRTNTATVTSTAAATTVTDTVTTTVGGGATVTETTTATESKFVCPIDGMEFDTLAELQAHFEATHPEGVPGLITLNVNGNTHMIVVKPNWTLLYVLREILGLPGAKEGCDRGECGSCTVIVNNMAVYACLMLAIEANGSDITTVEGLSDGITLSPIQQAFYDNDASQCGFCIPGMIMAGKAFLDENSNPTFDEVREAISGHICQCGNTKKIVKAVMAAKGGA